ncbi:LOW QUALITY PROTEIN: coiled-coil domain-containing protein 74B-like [Erythrolamprus reginae]|uniref:LOW QUALITY PROTEIN: coiled-coil domain-containing protein 74B-like n=1 Tax=Erythrolamprus reginae TaxID=121349 RepID=UPI00396C3242
MQGSGFPPLGYLPHWPRAGQPERPVRPFPPGPSDAPTPPTPPSRRAAPELERSLQFLQQQHAETLRQLHQEVDRLKRRNQDLQYRLIMQPLFQQADAERAAAEDEALAEEEEEEEAATPAGSPEWQRDASHFTPEPQQAAGGSSSSSSPGQRRCCQRRLEGVANVCASPTSDPEPGWRCENPLGLFQSLPGERVAFLHAEAPQVEECEVVIRQLWNINHMQMQELMYLRSCLDDIHKTKRIPEDYMLAGQLGTQESTKLPRVRNAPKKCRILTPLPAAERAVLPALKQTLGNAFAERQKRAQAVQRNRLHRTAL